MLKQVGRATDAVAQHKSRSSKYRPLIVIHSKAQDYQEAPHFFYKGEHLHPASLGMALCQKSCRP